MPVVNAFDPDTGASGGATPTLTGPATPAAVSLPSGSTSLGSTLIGSWSSSVAVTASVTVSDGSPAPTATVTGSGSGPYSVSVASGLLDGLAYFITLSGQDSFGQTVDVTLVVLVAAAVAAGGYTTIGSLNTWTFTDGQGLLSSNSYDAGTEQHTFNMNAVGTGADLNTFTAGTLYNGPKWWTPLFYDDGSPVNWNDAFELDILFDKIPTGLGTGWFLGVGVANDPTSTTLSNLNIALGTMGRTTTASPETQTVGICFRNSNTSVSASQGLLHGAASFNFTGKRGADIYNAPCGAGATGRRRSDNLPLTTGKIPIYWNSADGTQVPLMIMIGTGGANTAGAGPFTCRMRYKVTKIDFEVIP